MVTRLENAALCISYQLVSRQGMRPPSYLDLSTLTQLKELYISICFLKTANLSYNCICFTLDHLALAIRFHEFNFFMLQNYNRTFASTVKKIIIEDIIEAIINKKMESNTRNKSKNKNKMKDSLTEFHCMLYR